MRELSSNRKFRQWTQALVQFRIEAFSLFKTAPGACGCQSCSIIYLRLPTMTLRTAPPILSCRTCDHLIWSHFFVPCGMPFPCDFRELHGQTVGRRCSIPTAERAAVAPGASLQDTHLVDMIRTSGASPPGRYMRPVAEVLWTEATVFLVVPFIHQFRALDGKGSPSA